MCKNTCWKLRPIYSLAVTYSIYKSRSFMKRVLCPLSRPRLARTRCKIRVCVFARHFRHATCCATIAHSLPLNELFFSFVFFFSEAARSARALGPWPSVVDFDGRWLSHERTNSRGCGSAGRMRAEKIAAWGRINFRPVFLPALPSFLCGFFKMYLWVLMYTSLSQRSNSLTSNNSF